MKVTKLEGALGRKSPAGWLCSQALGLVHAPAASSGAECLSLQEAPPRPGWEQGRAPGTAQPGLLRTQVTSGKGRQKLQGGGQGHAHCVLHQSGGCRSRGELLVVQTGCPSRAALGLIEHIHVHSQLHGWAWAPLGPWRASTDIGPCVCPLPALPRCPRGAACPRGPRQCEISQALGMVECNLEEQ